MPQPRKEQIKNLRTKYIRFLGSPVIGGTSSQIISGADYTNFLAATRTHVIGGSETDSSAVAQGGAGPFGLTAGMSFAITLPGVNGNVFMPVVIQAGDIVNLGGFPVVTTARLANRINTVLAANGVSVPAAANIDGTIIIASVDTIGQTYGDSASITLDETHGGTPGILNTLGFTSPSTVVTGATAPKRGIITASSDGLGGFVQLKNLDHSQSEPVNTTMVHMGGRKYTPITLPGQPAFGRLRKYTGTSLKLDFYRNGPIPANFVSGIFALSNFSSITGGENILITVNYNAVLSAAFNVTFGAVTTVQNVIDQINAAYASTTSGIFGVESTRASVITKVAGPWSFQLGFDSFFLTFDNDPTQYQIFPAPGLASGYIYSTTDLVSRISFLIGAAGNVSIASDGINIIIESANPGPNSSVTFIPNATMANPNSMLDKLGISPGKYSSSTIASAYGNDEIQLICPTALPGSAIGYVGNLTITTKLGLAPSTSTTVGTGLGRVPVPPCQILIPEVVEFSEEPDSYDTEMQDFDAVGHPPVIDPKNGIANAGLVEGLLGPDGKIDPANILKILDFLSLDRLTLGSNFISNLTGQQQPRVLTPHDTTFGPMLIWAGPTIQGTLTANIARLYIYGGSLYLVINATVFSYGGFGMPSVTWIREGNSQPFMYEFTNGKLSVAVYTGVGTFAHAQWTRGVKANTTGTSDSFFGTELLKLGEGLTGSTAAMLIPRIEVAEDQVSPDKILLIECGIPLFNAFSYPVRVYITAIGTANSGIEITVNAKWDGALWNKDNSGLMSSILSLRNGFQYQSRLATNNTPWGVWDSSLLDVSSGLGRMTIPNALLVGFDLLGGVIADASTARIEAIRANVSVHHRTLLFVSQSGVNSPSIRIYLENSQTGLGNGFTFTSNALWNDATNKWNTEDGTSVSSAFSFVSSGPGGITSSINLYIKAAGAGPWDESVGVTGWDTIDFFNVGTSLGLNTIGTKDGYFSVQGSSAIVNPASTDPVVPNSLYAKSMVKSWGRANYTTGGGGGVIDGFNFLGISTSGTDWRGDYVTGLTNPGCVVLSPEVGTATTPNLIANVDNSSNGNFTISVRFPDTDTPYPQANAIIINHISLGTK